MRPRQWAAVGVMALSLVGPACWSRSDDEGSTGTSTTVTSISPVADSGDVAAVEVALPDQPRGGSVRVGVWAEPDPEAPTLGGAAVRALVLPQLFVARPDGRWSPSIVEPGTDRTSADRLSAQFRLRSRASWSDGSPITLDDVRRSMDARFVSSVEADPDGVITARFTMPLPGWRRLWSAQDSISAPSSSVWGGPFVVESVVPGLETVLRRNDRWSGPGGPFLDEVRLMLVPDVTTARLLLGRSELDVVMSPAATHRTEQFRAMAGVTVDRVEQGGWSVVLQANSAKLDDGRRRALFNSVDRAEFVTTLLKGEAQLLRGFASPEDATWPGSGRGDVGGLGSKSVDLVAQVEEPMSGLLHRSMQKAVRVGSKSTLELRQAESSRVERWLEEGSYDAAITMWLDPLGGCWVCRYPDRGLTAVAADGGSPASIVALEEQLRDDAVLLPLWRPATLVARRGDVRGIEANGYAASAAWNAWEWFVQPASGGG